MKVNIETFGDIYALMRVQEILFPFLNGNLNVPSTNEKSLKKQVQDAQKDEYMPIFFYAAGQYRIKPGAKIGLQIILKMIPQKFKNFNLDLPADLVEMWNTERVKNEKSK